MSAAAEVRRGRGIEGMRAWWLRHLGLGPQPRTVVLWSSSAGGRPTAVADGLAEGDGMGCVAGGCGTKPEAPGGPAWVRSDWLDPPGPFQDERLVLGVREGPPARWPRMTLRKAVMEKMLSGSSPFCERGGGTARKRSRGGDGQCMREDGTTTELVCCCDALFCFTPCCSPAARDASHQAQGRLRHAERQTVVKQACLPDIDDIHSRVVAQGRWERDGTDTWLNATRQDLREAGSIKRCQQGSRPT